MKEEVPRLRAANVVVTFRLLQAQHRASAAWESPPEVQKLSLRQIAQRFPGVEYAPRQFAAAKLRMSLATVLLFGSGKCVCTGARSVPVSRYAISLFARILSREAKMHFSTSHVTVQNLVFSAHCGFLIDLWRLHEENNLQSQSYQPDMFPGLCYRPETGAVVFLVYRSGRCVITGARSHGEAEAAWSEFFESKLLAYRDTVNTTACSAEYRQQKVALRHDGSLAAARLAAGADPA